MSAETVSAETVSSRLELSVIIPAYNAASYLAEAIRSALAQSLPPREVIVVDDGSTDATAEVARSFGGPVQVVQQANQGVAAARNQGITRARHPWLAFLDADDVMASERLEVQAGCLMAEPSLDAVLGQQQYFDASAGGSSRAAVDHQAATPAMIPSALTCRADVFARFGRFDTQLQGPEFIAWFARAGAQGIRYRVLPRVVVHRRIHADNLSRTSTTATSSYLQMVKQHLDRRRSGAA